MLAPLVLALAWQAGPPLPLARTEVAGAAYAGGVAVVGGYLADGRSSGRVDLYRPGRGWSRLPTLPVRVNHASATASRGRMYVVGGVGAGGLAKNGLVLTRGRWRRVPGPTPRQHVSGTALGSTIYVVGGRTAGYDTNLYIAESWTPGQGAWRRLPPLPSPRGGTGLAA